MVGRFTQNLCGSTVSKPPPRGRLRKALLNKSEHRARAHDKDWLAHAARVHLVILLISGGDAFEGGGVFHFLDGAFDDYRFLSVVVGDGAGGIRGEVPALAGFSSR